MSKNNAVDNLKQIRSSLPTNATKAIITILLIYLLILHYQNDRMSHFDRF
jgi:hypothetical protein